MKDQEFITAEGVGGYLEYTGLPLAVDEGRYYANRSEVRQVLAGFEVHDVQFKSSAVGWLEDRRAISGVYQSKSEAIQAVKDSERDWFQCVAEDLQDQIERKRIEDAYEHQGVGIEPAQTNKELSERQYRVELAREFRQAVEALRTGMLQEMTCDWCGVDLQAVNDHKMVDRQPMCLPCVSQYSLEEGKDYER
jgi:hypothetical protein